MLLISLLWHLVTLKCVVTVQFSCYIKIKNKFRYYRSTKCIIIIIIIISYIYIYNNNNNNINCFVIRISETTCFGFSTSVMVFGVD